MFLSRVEATMEGGLPALLEKRKQQLDGQKDSKNTDVWEGRGS